MPLIDASGKDAAGCRGMAPGIAGCWYMAPCESGCHWGPFGLLVRPFHWCLHAGRVICRLAAFSAVLLQVVQHGLSCIRAGLWHGVLTWIRSMFTVGMCAGMLLRIALLGVFD